MNLSYKVTCPPVANPPGEDLDLWRAAAGGDHAAFHALVDRHGPALFRLAMSLSGSRCDAEDICQETFAAAYRGLKSFAGRSSVKTWLCSILIRRASKMWKKGRHARRTLSLHRQPDDSRDAPNAVAEPHCAGRASGRVDQRLDILEAIQTLAPEFRQAIVLREIDGMSYQEIADTLSVPRGTVESRLHRGRAELRKRLSDY